MTLPVRNDHSLNVASLNAPTTQSILRLQSRPIPVEKIDSQGQKLMWPPIPFPSSNSTYSDFDNGNGIVVLGALALVTGSLILVTLGSIGIYWVIRCCKERRSEESQPLLQNQA